MKKLILLCIILLSITNLIAQQNFTAIIADPQIGEGSNAENLIKIVDDINTRDSIAYVIVMGNLTSNGKFEEFLQAQEILDGLSVKYNVVGGEKDYTLSEGKGNEISMAWGDDKFIHYLNDDVFVGLNSIKSVYNSKGYYEIESRLFLQNNLNNNIKGQVFFIRNNNYSKQISNWDEMIGEFRKIFGSKSTTLINIIAIDEEKAKRKTEMPYIALSTSLGGKEGWKYFLIKSNDNELSKIEISRSNDEVGVMNEILNNSNRLPLRSIGTLMQQNSTNFNPIINIGKTIYSSPVFNGNKLITASKSGTVFCFANDGKEKWKFETNGTIYSSPIIEGDLVVVATNEGDLFTINSNTGNLFQVIGIGETITSNISLIELKDDQSNAIAFGTASGNFYCYDLYSLEFLWQNSSANDWIISSISSNDGKIFLQDRKGKLYCISAESGMLLWKWEPGNENSNPYFKSDLILNKNEIYLIDSNENLICIDALLGTEKWNLKKIDAAGLIRFNKGEIFISTNDNEILKISQKLGRVISEIELPLQTKGESITDFIFIDDEMFAGFTNGEVYQIKHNQNPEVIFNSSSAPVVSLKNLNGNCLVTDFDGRMSLLKLVK